MEIIFRIVATSLFVICFYQFSVHTKSPLCQYSLSWASYTLIKEANQKYGIINAETGSLYLEEKIQKFLFKTMYFVIVFVPLFFFFLSSNFLSLPNRQNLFKQTQILQSWLLSLAIKLEMNCTNEWNFCTLLCLVCLFVCVNDKPIRFVACQKKTPANPIFHRFHSCILVTPTNLHNK